MQKTRDLKVLIVEDSPAVVLVISRIVRSFGKQVEIITAVDGVEGLVAAWQHHPDIIITRLYMARMDGYEMVRLLRREQTGSQIKIIGLSGQETSRTRVVAFRQLCDGFLAKPFTRSQLWDTLGQVLATPQPAVLPPESGLEPAF